MGGCLQPFFQQNERLFKQCVKKAGLFSCISMLYSRPCIPHLQNPFLPEVSSSLNDHLDSEMPAQMEPARLVYLSCVRSARGPVLRCPVWEPAAAWRTPARSGRSVRQQTE